MSEYKDKKTSKTSTEAEITEELPSGGSNVDEEDYDALLDEIDGVLEENAEQFVNSYIQKGGQ